jgi:phosphoadenosine phosphosulfate reductase
MNRPLEFDAEEAALADKIAAAARRLAEIARDYSPAAFANSLGAEDMVLTDLIQRQGLAIEIFSLDTGRLPEETYALMRDVQHRYGLKIKLYYPRHDLIEEYASSHGINAFRDSVELRRACCHIRKVEPLRRALAGKRAWITGMRAQQAMTRGALPLRQFDETNGLEKFNPLADWSEQEVWAYLRGRAVPYNALHDRHYPSIGCAPCTRAISAGEDLRSGRWWWESADTKECGLHRIPVTVSASAEANVSAANVKAHSAGRSQIAETQET